MAKSKKDNRGRYPKLYKVTGECFKLLCMERNKNIRKYYIKVEKLAMMMNEYISILHKVLFKKREMELKNLLLEEKKKNDNRSNLLQGFVEGLESQSPNGFVYIATTKKYAQTNYFKLGITSNTNKANLKTRLRQYNTERPENDMVYYAFTYECCDPHMIEKKLKYLLKSFQRKNKYKNKFDETYNIAYKQFHNIVKIVCEHHDEEIDVLNKIIKNYEEEYMNEPFIPPPIKLAQEEKTITVETNTNGNTTTRQITVDISNMSDDQKEKEVIKAIEKLIQKDNPEFKYEENKNNEDDIVIAWKNIQPFLKTLYNKKSEWRAGHWIDTVKKIKNNTKCIEKIRGIKT